MHNSGGAGDEIPDSKFRRATKRARGTRHDEQAWEPGEHTLHLESMRKRRAALSIADTVEQINSYFNRN